MLFSENIYLSDDIRYACTDSHSGFSKNSSRARQGHRNRHSHSHTHRRSSKRKTRPLCHFRVSDLSPAVEMKPFPVINYPPETPVEKGKSEPFGLIIAIYKYCLMCTWPRRNNPLPTKHELFRQGLYNNRISSRSV
jgi:hypothetical protein